MNTSVISFEQSRQFSRLILDYIRQAPELADFYRHQPVIEAYREAIAEKKYPDHFRPVLVNTLKKQYEAAGINLKKQKAVAANIESLLQPGTFTVTTGHQLCLFTGPLYFIYKILTTIAWCEELKTAYPENQFVPVFWMASEDHDFAEVNHFFVQKEKITWNADSGEQPVGRLSLSGIETVVKTLLEKTENEFARQQVQQFADFYTSSPNLAVATHKLVNHLFADKGLVVLDADEPALKQLFVPYILNDILEQTNFQALQDTNTQLRKTYKTQVNGREINFFYLGEHGRKLIRQDNDRFVVEDTAQSFSPSELRQDVEAHPENYSPNVIMRPLYQEVILPNLSYVGGPGEIAYWLQLKGVFEHNNIPFPVLTLRNFILLVKEQHQNQLLKMGLNSDDLFTDDIEIARKLVTLNDDGGQKELVHQFDTYLQELVAIAEKTDNKISSELIGYKTTWKKTLLKLSAELDKKQRQKVSTQTDKATGIKSTYFLNNVMQERFENLFSYGITQSISDLLTTIGAEVDISSNGIKKIVIPG